MAEEQKKESFAPIKAPPSFTSSAPSRSLKNPVKKDYTAPKRFTSRRERKKRAGKTQRGALNLRRVAMGLGILFIMGTAFYLFTNPTAVEDIISGDALKNDQTCTVERTNSTMFFTTSCGSFEWDGALLGGSPSTALTVGGTYVFHSSGMSIPIAGTYPKVHAVEPA